MRTYRSPTGPFRERPFYKDADIERLCSDALRQAGFLPSVPEPVRIDRFVEKYFGVRIIFEELHPGVLGYTEFGPNGVVAVHIGDTSPSGHAKVTERRTNSTIAHEAGHGLMHAHLFVLGDDVGTLFGSDPDVSTTRVLCRDGSTSGGPAARQRTYDGRWWELQANRAIGALLLPVAPYFQFMELYLSRQRRFGALTVADNRREEAIRAAAEAFDVNPVVARIRLDMLYPVNRTAQLTL